MLPIHLFRVTGPMTRVSDRSSDDHVGTLVICCRSRAGRTAGSGLMVGCRVLISKTGLNVRSVKSSKSRPDSQPSTAIRCSTSPVSDRHRVSRPEHVDWNNHRKFASSTYGKCIVLLNRTVIPPPLLLLWLFPSCRVAGITDDLSSPHRPVL